MIELAVLQTASYLIAALSFAVTCAYYIMNLRTQQTNMKMTLETWQAQFLMSPSQRFSDPEYQDNFFTTMSNMSWSD